MRNTRFWIASILLLAGAALVGCDRRPSSSTIGAGGGWGEGASTVWYLDLHGGTTSDANHIIGLAADGSATVIVDRPETVAAGDALTLPRGMCLLGDGSLLVVSAFKNDTQILRYGLPDANGRRAFVGVFVHGGALNPSLQHPYEIAVGPDGNVYAANQDTQTITRYAGLHSPRPGTPVPAPAGSVAAGAHCDPGVIVPSAKQSIEGLETPRGITFGPDGLLYVVDRDARITAWNVDTGAMVRVVLERGSGKSGQGAPAIEKAIQAHFIRGTGTMLVGDRGAKTVWKTDATGSTLERFLPEGVTIEEPSIITSDGIWVYVGDRATKSIRRFNIGSGQPEAGAPWVAGLPDAPEFLIPARLPTNTSG